MTDERKRRKKPAPRRHDLPCIELGPDDGIDPRYLFRNDHAPSRDDRKVQQLCAQAARALRLALAGECRDPVLQQVDVLRVEPGPDARRLRVVVRPPLDETPIAEVMDRLAAVHGLLRSAVATAIQRRRAPQIYFEVRPDDEVES